MVVLDLGLFGFIYFTLLSLSAAMEINLGNHFQDLIFLIISLASFIWFFSYQLDESSLRNL